MPVGRYFIAGLWVFGLLSAIVLSGTPALRALPVPSLAWPLGAALLVDLALMPLTREGRVQPLTMNERAIAVIGAALIHTLALAALAA